jgi:hypothetical protein
MIVTMGTSFANFVKWLNESSDSQLDAHVTGDEVNGYLNPFTLLAMSADNEVSLSEWITDFETYYDCDLFSLQFSKKMEEELRKEYSTGDYAWHYFSAVVDAEKSEDTGVPTLNDTDRKVYQDLLDDGWEKLKRTVTQTVSDRIAIVAILRKELTKEEKKKRSKHLVAFIKTYKYFNHQSLEHLSKMLEPEDSQSIRGQVHGAKYGI